MATAKGISQLIGPIPVPAGMFVVRHDNQRCTDVIKLVGNVSAYRVVLSKLNRFYTFDIARNANDAQVINEATNAIADFESYFTSGELP